LSLIQILRCSSSSTAILRRTRAGLLPDALVSHAPWSHVLPCVKRGKRQAYVERTHVSTGVKTKHVSTCMKRMKLLRVFKRHASQPL
jgi:hypothetical protein